MQTCMYASPDCSDKLILKALTYILDINYISLIVADSFNTEDILDYLHDHNLLSSFDNTITTTIKSQTFIDNIYATSIDVDCGRYISFISVHASLWLKIHS
jgi:hypothetical protein